MDSIISGLYGLMNHAPELPKSWKQADEQDSWRDKAKDVILKKIKKEKGLAALEDFRRILTIQNSNTNCLLVDKSKDGRWQVHHLKGLPHVFVCRIWRWPDLRSYCELRTAQNSNCSHPYVHHSKSNHQKVMCINPYHYVKATSSATVPPPVLVPRHFDPMPTSSSSSTLDENYLQPGGTTNWVVEPTNNILNNQSQPRQENDLAMPSSHMSSGLVSHSDLSFSTMDFEHEPVYYQEPEDYWCKVAYFETNDRVGELYHAKNDVFQIDGFTNPRMDANRFSLGQLCNIKRNSSIENTRRHIGKVARNIPIMVMKETQKKITVKRGSSGFGLSLVYRGTDRFEKEDTGIFVSKLVPGGQAALNGVKVNDRILSINHRTPVNVDDAVNIIREGGKKISLIVCRQEAEEGRYNNTELPEADRISIGSAHSIQSSRSTRSTHSTRSSVSSKSLGGPIRRINATVNDFMNSLNYDSVPPIDSGYTTTISTPRAGTLPPRAKSSMDGFLVPKDQIIKPAAAAPLTKERANNFSKSNHSLHQIGVNDYPYPEMPESSRLNREGEKKSLQNLNNRLAGYIDRVRQLQQDNQRLNNLVEKYEKHESEETIKIKKVYDNQIEDLKTALDTMDRQFNELKINENGLHQENADMKNKLRKKDADIGKANERNGILMEDMRQLANQLSILESEKSKIQQQLQETIPELQTLQGKLADAKKTIDAEQLKNADLKNTYSRLEEDHAFKIQMLESEVQKVVEISRIEKEKIEDRTTQQYEERLQKALEQLRDVYETKMKQNKEDFEQVWEQKVKELQTQLNLARGNNVCTQEEMKENKVRIKTLMVKVSDLENTNLALNQKISDFIQTIDNIKSSHRSEMNVKDEEMQRLLEQLNHQQKEYQKLQDIKIQLDMEIAVYRQLLETEEDRLGLKPIPPQVPPKPSSHLYRALPGFSNI